MTPSREPDTSAARDAWLAAALLAIDPELVGASVAAASGSVRDPWIAHLTGIGPRHNGVRRIPLGISDAQLFGGLDLHATLAQGRLVSGAGLLADAAGACFLISMSERWPAAAAARLAGAMDARPSTSSTWIALDESAPDEEPPSAALRDRLAFWIRLDAVSLRDVPAAEVTAVEVAEARVRLPTVDVPEHLIAGIVQCAVQLGAGSTRVDGFAVRAMRANAALCRRQQANEDDAVVAARLVLAPRATRLPEPEAETPAQEPEAPPPSSDQQPEQNGVADGPLEDQLIQAAATALPKDLLAALSAAGPPAAGRSGDRGRSRVALQRARRGRPVGNRRGDPRRDGPLALLATVMAAAPWQRWRAREFASSAATAHRRNSLIFMPSDLRVVRFEDRATVTTIFVVDASGSSALHRMGEAKGAIELMLADCYVRRDRVAMIAFRGTKADVLLAPTRSLARARRALSGLAGGGATPLADGLKLALALAEGIRRAGGERQIALLTDGRANIDLAGTSDRSSAERDAMTLAGHVAAARIPAVVIDTAPRNSPRLREIALAMRARYVALPHADAHAIKTAVTSSAPRSARAM